MRDTLIILGMCVLAAAIGAWLYLYGPKSVQPVPQQPISTTTAALPAVSKDIPFEVFDQGTHAAGVSARKNYAAYDSANFAKLWKMAHGGDGTPIPNIDFTKQYVVGVFAGQEPSGGYSIAVTKVTDRTDERNFSIRIQKPGTNCIVTQALTNPYQIVSVPLSASALTHTDETIVTDCK